MIIQLLQLLFSICVAIGLGKIITKLKLPSILGWLIAGMAVGPHALSIINNDLLNAHWYHILLNILECCVGLMIGTELVFKKLKKSGKSIFITTLTQSLGTFIVVTIVFAIVFSLSGIPLYLAVILGGIALATAPAPALSIVKEFKTKGPVTNTLIPMAALDDMVGCIVFFSAIAIIASQLAGGSIPGYIIPIVLILPLIIGALTGIIYGKIIHKTNDKTMQLITLIIAIIITSVIGLYVNNHIMPKPVLNFMLIGMAFSTAFANMIGEEKLEQLMHSFNPILNVALIIVILNLGAPLNYTLIFGAGIYTLIYILSRAFGKYFGAYFGSSITNAPETVKKYLGLTLLPHSGVSLVFTGIAVNVLSSTNPSGATIIQGTIAAAAVINEIIAVILAKKGFELANEIKQ